MNLTHDTQLLWRGTYKGLAYEIKHWGIASGLNDGHGVWNYYVYLHETKVKDFNSLWLSPNLVKITPESKGFVNYDYSRLAVASDVDWHGGVTFYTKHGEVEGFRCVQLGCDYSHLWDMEGGWQTTLADVEYDLIQTIDQLQPFLLP